MLNKVNNNWYKYNVFIFCCCGTLKYLLNTLCILQEIDTLNMLISCYYLWQNSDHSRDVYDHDSDPSPAPGDS